MVATRNIDSKTEYQELKRYQQGKDKALYSILFVGHLGSPNMEDAIDDAVKQVEGVEYMKNVVVREQFNWYFLFSIRVYKVEGDVWGKQP